jgi:hypothetical protein
MTDTVVAKEECQHPNLPPVPFDHEAARGLDSYEIRKRWPRGSDLCNVCGNYIVRYASFEHYCAGDW